MKNILNERVFASFAIGICVILSAYVFMKGYRDRNGQENVIHVTGMGSRNFDSDLIVWRGSFSKTSIDLAAASAATACTRSALESSCSHPARRAGACATAPAADDCKNSQTSAP